MLESEEVDDDYFTPVAKTSLASIFRKPESGEKAENESLKYTPPVLKSGQNVEETAKKSFETVFSCVFDAFLWLDNVYTNKGKLGCAIVKHHNADGVHSFYTILLYDSKKSTVSSAVASKNLEITVKGNVLSYYDRYEKYWCLNGSDNDIKNILEILNKCDVTIKVALTNPLENQTMPQKSKEAVLKTETNKKNTESDTDSSINRKTKASILNRMASMGQSVLPTRAVAGKPSSDSSDTNEYDEQVVAVRHKPVKNTVKKLTSEKTIPDLPAKPDVHKYIPSTAQDVKTVVAFESQIIPLQNTVSLASASNQDLNYFFTEQRIANSELRINMTRVTDKVDDILNKVNCLEKNKKEGSAINIEIYQKLLNEYESKIKTYEELLQNMSKEKDSVPKSLTIRVADNNELTELNNKFTELNNCLKQRDSEISALNNEMVKLKEERKSSTEPLQGKLSEFKEEVDKNKEIINKLTHENEESQRSHDDNIHQKIKSIMNDTFRAIEMNFEANESYLGGEIKNIIATVIKKVTIEALNKGK